MNMSDNNKQVAKTILAASAGVGIIFVISRYRKDLSRKVLNVFSRNPLRSQKIEVVNTFEECSKLVQRLKRDCNDYPVLGFDCEWVTLQGSRQPVALLQLSTYTGLCGLIRMCKLRRMPPDLRDILEDEEIVKVGVSPQDDAKYLSHDYAVGVASTLDLRYLAFEAQIKGEGLGKMSKSLLNIELDKDWRIRCSDWEDPQLSDKQIQYAANDAFVAIELFKKIADMIVPKTMWTYKKDRLQEVLEICNKFLDIRYKELTIGNTTVPLGGSPTRTRKNLGSGPPQKEFKRFTGGTRQRPLYDNCYMEAPDGELLCTCDRSKAEWYINKGLATLLSEDPFRIRLTFEPTGRAVGEVGKYYTIPKENKCVVCGKEDTFIRKNVVPREYRKHFPVVMKDHTSHDILLLCTICHQLSNMSDLNLRQTLAEVCEAPIQTQENTRLIEVPQLKKLKSAARALYRNADKIPESRRKQIEEQFLEHFPSDTEITTELLEEYIDIDVYKDNENFLRHGEKVVQHFMTRGGGIIQLEKMWRQHFLKSMKPKFMPELWSVDHNEHRLEIRADEGRIEVKDLAAAGLNPNLLDNSNASNISRVSVSESKTLTSDELKVQEIDETEFFSLARASSAASTTSYLTARGDDDTTISSSSFKSMDETLRQVMSLQDKDTEYFSDDTDSTLTQPSSSFGSDTEMPTDDDSKS